MQLLVIRHAIAEDREAFAATGRADDARPLTNDGARKMGRCARGLQALVPTIDTLVSSPLTRAKQTAEIVRERYELDRVEEAAELDPDVALDDVVKGLSRYGGGLVAIVGHEPQLGRLVTYLISGVDRAAVQLKKGAACLLEFEGPPQRSGGTMRWSASPKMLRDLAG
jgi:phosphohistidine phosphatase